MTWTIFSVARGKVLVASGDQVPWLCPSLCSKLTFPTFADAVSFFCLCYLTWFAHDSKLQLIKITQFFGTGIRYGKVKKTTQFLTPKKNIIVWKECATKFMTLADYIIPRKTLWGRKSWKHLSHVSLAYDCVWPVNTAFPALWKKSNSTVITSLWLALPTVGMQSLLWEPFYW